MSFGLTAEGFVPKALADVLADLVAALKAAFGSTAKADVASSNLGQLAGIFAERFAELWEIDEVLYHVVDPDAATGAAQDQLCAITGTDRKLATHSNVTAYLLGTNGTTIPAGSVASVTGTGDRFALDTDEILFSISAWAPTTAYVAGDVVTHDSGKVYGATTGGTSAGSGGPTGTGSNIADGGVVWDYLGTGFAGASGGPVAFTAEETGPIPATAGTLTTIETPVAGWSAIVNVADAVLGTAEETDALLRVRRESEIAPAGASTPEAIRGAILKVTGVTSCTVYYNDTATTDGNGTSAHTVRAEVLGGADADVAAAIFASVAAGIDTQGATSVSLTDSEGNAHTIDFERPTTVAVYVTVTLTYDASKYPSDGDVDVKDAIKALGDTYPIGKDVTAWAMGAPLDSVPGILDVSSVKIGTSPSPSGSTTISIDGFHLAVFDTSRIVVVSSPGTP